MSTETALLNKTPITKVLKYSILKTSTFSVVHEWPCQALGAKLNLLPDTGWCHLGAAVWILSMDSLGLVRVAREVLFIVATL